MSRFKDMMEDLEAQFVNKIGLIETLQMLEKICYMMADEAYSDPKCIKAIGKSWEQSGKELERAKEKIKKIAESVSSI